MSWPPFVDELKRRYLAEEGSVFLLHGAVGPKVAHPAGGEWLECALVLHRFLQSSRPVVGVLDPDPSRGKDSPERRRSRLDFPGIEDRASWMNHLRVSMMMEGRSRPVDDTHLENAMGAIWRSSTRPGLDQAWIVRQAELLAPARAKNLAPFAFDAPPIAEWNLRPELRSSNNVVILLAEDPTKVRPDVLAGCVLVEVKAPAQAAPPPVARALPQGQPSAADAEAEVEAALSAASEAPAEAPAPPPPEAPALDQQLREALTAAVLRWPEGGWPGDLPAREALGAVLHAAAPDRFGPFTWSEVEGAPKGDGPGAAELEEWLRSDIAVSAACGMALGELKPPFKADSPPVFPDPALRALARRVERLLRS